MNQEALAQLIIIHFGASAMTIGAIVFAVLLMLMLYITIRDHLLNFENSEKTNVQPRSVEFPGEF